VTGLDSLLASLETSRVAVVVGQSISITAWLSALHLVGMTIVTGGIVVSALRLLGVLLADEPVAVVAAAASRGVGVGLGLSVTTGVLLFAPRASSAAANEFFQVKMLLLVAGVAFHVLWYRHVAEQGLSTTRSQRLSGLVALLLWIGVALAGCAFILLE
jgi:hypothetical protein